MKYLAYWMLTAGNISEGVTESLLVRQASEYLQDHNIEDPHEAEVAAREFVEFCRGRAWVFSDAGSTADGEPLYKFTHRTFMEYFAAYHLTRMSDSPERLARVLISRVANAEWDVVAQLAVQIMDKHSEAGADRIFTHFLTDRVRRSRKKRNNILGFLGRCLSFATVQPRTIRNLTALVLETLTTPPNPATSRKDRSDSSSLGWLLANATEQTEQLVREEVERVISILAQSPNTEVAINALEVAVQGYITPLTMTARVVVASNVLDWMEAFYGIFDATYQLAAPEVRGTQFLRIHAYGRSLISFADLMGGSDDLAPFTTALGSDIVGAILQSVADTVVLQISTGDSWFPWIVNPERILEDVGRHVRSQGIDSVFFSRARETGYLLGYKAPDMNENSLHSLSDLALLGTVVLACATLENLDFHFHRYPRIKQDIEHYPPFLTYLISLWRLRVGEITSVGPAPIELASETSEILARWSKSELTFVRPQVGNATDSFPGTKT